MNVRLQSISHKEKKGTLLAEQNVNLMLASERFGKRTFNLNVMEEMLPKHVFKNIKNAISGTEKLKYEFADIVAFSMKDWAIQNGATHYSHWFQPLTGSTAEKQDAFIDWTTPDRLLEQFDGARLLQGEPDASSFPSGGLRSTYEARGYTGWDPSTPPFLWKAGDGVTLCIPCVFFSWTGDVLDSKIPLLRSDRKIHYAVKRLMTLLGESTEHAFSTLGWEQEYFVIDRNFRNLRPDLVSLGKTVYGASPPKGQELQDHYFGAVKDKILAYMRDFENSALELGIPIKTRHNEVAPAQHEIASSYESAVKSVDHNILIMEVMRQTALDHNLCCLLHEKPFARINGSGKHNNWSLGTVEGENLLDPSATGRNKNIRFTILLTAVLWAVHKHAALLRSAVCSAANDNRLGGHEAPPAIISVYLGTALEEYLQNIEKGNPPSPKKGKERVDLGILVLPDLSRDDTDRNRTSPFAFTGQKFEFRAVGSSASCALPITVINVIVADALNIILDEVEKNKSDSFEHSALSVVRKYLKESKSIRFSGDNYTKEWELEAKRRDLPNLKYTPQALRAISSPSSIKVFSGVLNKQELSSLHDVFLEKYLVEISIEINLMLGIFQTQIFPSGMKAQKNLASSIKKANEFLPKTALNLQIQYLSNLSKSLEESLKEIDKLRSLQEELTATKSLSKQGDLVTKKIITQMEKTREVVDSIELLVDDDIWPLPKYREMLFLI